MKLFLSHASEDKEFVRQLDERLRVEGFEVWLDERNLKLGDSLLGKINEGLLDSDYGVVVLSPTFFGKKWTKAELGALMALETATRKMILPIWKGLSAAKIAELAPILADRIAVDAARGLDVVVQSIKSAVGGAEHQRSLSRLDRLKARLAAAGSFAKERRAADILLNSEQGVRLIGAEFARLGELLETTFSSLSSEELKFEVRLADNRNYTVIGPRRYAVEIRYRDGAHNSAFLTSFLCIFYRFGKIARFGEREETKILDQIAYYPYFGANSMVVWCPGEDRKTTNTTDEVVLLIAEKLSDYVESAGS